MTSWIGIVMKNFDVPHNASGVIRVQCKLCQTFISGTSTSAGNFMKHLKRKHADIYVALISVKYKFDTSAKGTKTHNSKASNLHQEDSESNEGSPKKCMNYSPEFKQTVLEYYFKNGGENQFGLKSKTAQVFRIDKKTINRMLCNPEMVRKACKAVNQKPPTVFGTSKNSNEYSSPSHSTDNYRTGSQNSVIDLPEDPDFSVLKQAISSPASGIGSVTRLLLSGTKEVQKIILEECDIIYECKVCKNLFRSLVNFLAHKRIYCIEQFVNVQNIFHKDNCGGRTTDSNTLIVEPEPPDNFTGPKIDQIAAKLASKSTKNIDRIDELSSSVNKGSSNYYDRIQRTQERRNVFRKDCSIILKNVSNDNKAVFQDYVPHGEHAPLEGTKELAKQVTQIRDGVTVILDEDGKIIATQAGTPPDIDLNNLKEIKNNSYIDPSPLDSLCDSPSIEESEMDELDSYKRTIYTCPICSTMFLSMGGCNKHLLKVHKKKKHQRERLRQVIASRTYKKVFTKEALKNYHLKSENKMHVTVSSSLEDNKTPKAPEDKIRCENNISHREDNITKLQNICIRCKKTFLTTGALGSHTKYCQFQLMNSKSNEQPEKKIAIQIRKDYKKDFVTNSFTSDILSNRQRIELSTKDIIAEHKRITEELEEKSKLLSDPVKLKCIPCQRRFPKRSSLQYHLAKHLSYNRYKCLNCDFRSYHRYTIARHCEYSHATPNSFTDEDKLGTFVYYLNDQNNETSADKDYKNLLNSVEDIKCEDDYTKEYKFDDNNETKFDDTKRGTESEDEVTITNDCDPLAIECPTKEEIEDPEDIKMQSQENLDLLAKAERPQRQRRSIEQKDFIYEVKHPQPTKQMEDEVIKVETNKRKFSPVEDLTRKKALKIEDNLCNGKSSSKPMLQIPDKNTEGNNSVQVNNALEICPQPSLSPEPSTE